MTLAFDHEALAGRVVFGPGARHRIAEEVDRVAARRVLLIAGRGSTATAAEQAHAALGPRAGARFDEIRVHVPVELAGRAVAAAREAAADALVCLGGGAAIGLGKAVALELGLPVIAVPTTYSGSEMTPIWGTTGGRTKRTGRDLRVLPRTVIYDPELTVSLPPDVSGPSGINALAHCIEALYAPGADPPTALLAEEGIRALARALPAVVADGTDLQARSTALYGAYLAGASLALTGTSVHHKIAHLLGGRWDLPHAPMHAILLPHSVAFVAPAVPDALRRIAAALDTEAVPSALFDLLAALGIPRALTRIGMPAAALDDAVRLVVDAAPASPREVGEDAIRHLLRGALHGAPPAT